MPCPPLSSVCPAQWLGSSFFSVLSPPPAASSRAAEFHSSRGAVHMIFFPGAVTPSAPWGCAKMGPGSLVFKGLTMLALPFLSSENQSCSHHRGGNEAGGRLV